MQKIVSPIFMYIEDGKREQKDKNRKRRNERVRFLELIQAVINTEKQAHRGSKTP